MRRIGRLISLGFAEINLCLYMKERGGQNSFGTRHRF